MTLWLEGPTEVENLNREKQRQYPALQQPPSSSSSSSKYQSRFFNKKPQTWFLSWSRVVALHVVSCLKHVRLRLNAKYEILTSHQLSSLVQKENKIRLINHKTLNEPIWERFRDLDESIKMVLSSLWGKKLRFQWSKDYEYHQYQYQEFTKTLVFLTSNVKFIHTSVLLCWHSCTVYETSSQCRSALSSCVHLTSRPHEEVGSDWISSQLVPTEHFPLVFNSLIRCQ